MVTSPNLPVLPPPGDPTLAALITRAADRACRRTLIICAVLGGAAALAPWVLHAARLIPTAVGLCVAAFGVRGLASHALAVDPRAVGLRLLAKASVAVGIVSGVVGAFWIFFRLMGSSFWN